MSLHSRPIRRTRKAQPRATGFTMIELMVTVAIVAIFSAIAAPGFRQLIAAQRVRAAGSALTESLWLARSEAIKRNDNVTFNFANGIVAPWDVTPGTTGVPTVAVPAVHHQDGFPTVQATTASNADVSFRFNAYGRLASGTTSVRLEVPDSGVYRYVCISTTGRAVVQEAACS